MDWEDEAYHLDLTDADVEQLNRLEELRISNATIWAMLRGSRSSRGIATATMRPHQYVLEKLRELKKAGWTYDSQGKKGVVWRLEEEVVEYEYPGLLEWLRYAKHALFTPIFKVGGDDDVDWANARVLGVWDGKEVVEPPSTE